MVTVTVTVTVTVMVMVVVWNWRSLSTNSVSGLTMNKRLQPSVEIFLKPTLWTSSQMMTSAYGLFGARVSWIKAFSLLHFRMSDMPAFILSLSVQFYSLHFCDTRRSISVMYFFIKN